MWMIVRISPFETMLLQWLSCLCNGFPSWMFLHLCPFKWWQCAHVSPPAPVLYAHHCFFQKLRPSAGHSFSESTQGALVQSSTLACPENLYRRTCWQKSTILQYRFHPGHSYVSCWAVVMTPLHSQDSCPLLPWQQASVSLCCINPPSFFDLLCGDVTLLETIPVFSFFPDQWTLPCQPDNQGSRGWLQILHTNQGRTAVLLACKVDKGPLISQ